jgi:predicted Rossmann fold flavoprotein
MKKNQIKFDIVVIGGGPAGMFAAIKASENQLKVALVEKNNFLGKKLLITGGNRCNLTQAEFNNKNFVKKLGKKQDFLLSGLSLFNSKSVIDFFEKNNLKTKTERGNRVFPLSDKSSDVVKVLIKKLNENNVDLILGKEINKINLDKTKIKSIETNQEKIIAKSFIIATGGKAYPSTGSTGSGYQWAKKIGHKIIDPKPALTPIKVKEDWIKELQGLSLKNVEVSIIQNNKKQESRFGEMLFTCFGVTGPIILDLSKKINQLLQKGQVFLKIDLKPALDLIILDKRLQRDFKGNQTFRNYLPSLVPRKLKKIIIKTTNINPDKKIGQINKQERKRIINFLKNFNLTVKEPAGFNYAIITTGGIDLAEIEGKTMQSKIIENLFFAGEIIDLDGPTGGYNLQICWTTGYLAGINAKKYTEKF